MILPLPDTRQSGPTDCGPAAVRCVFGLLEVKGRKPAHCRIDGTDPRTLEAALRAAGVGVQAGTMDADDLRHHTRKGRPVVCLVRENGTGHWVVVAGVERGRVTVQCPVHGPRVEPVAAFVARWWDEDRMGVRYLQWGIACG